MLLTMKSDTDIITQIQCLCEKHNNREILDAVASLFSAQELQNMARRAKYDEDDTFRSRVYASCQKSFKKSYNTNEEFRQRVLAKNRAAYARRKGREKSDETSCTSCNQ